MIVQIPEPFCFLSIILNSIAYLPHFTVLPILDHFIYENTEVQNEQTIFVIYFSNKAWASNSGVR